MARQRAITFIGVLAAAAVFMVWYAIAANYDYAVLAGTYVVRVADESCELRLRPDQTFAEELRHSGQTLRAEGPWRRYGEAHGEFEKTLGLFPKLVLAPHPDGPTLQKKWFR